MLKRKNKHNKNSIRVYCKTLNKWFPTITKAAKFAGANGWTMSLKMGTAGSFIDKNGNEYIRSKPLASKENYKNTGPELHRHVLNKVSRKKMDVSEAIQTQFTPDTTGRFPIVSVGTPKAEKKAKPVVKKEPLSYKERVRSLLQSEKTRLLKEAGIYEEISGIDALLEAIGA